MDEWIFVQSKPVIKGICPCGRTGLKGHFMIENRLTGHQTVVGSGCIRKFIKN